MKKKLILLTLFACFFFGMAFGQVLNKGNFIVGSTVGFSTANSKISQTTDGVKDEGKGPSSLQISVSPNVGYFLTDDFALGLGMDFTFSRLKDKNRDRTDDSDFLFGPFSRYYLPVAEGMAFFWEAEFGFGNSSDDQFIGSDKQSISTNIFAIGTGPGFTIYSSQSIGIEAIMKYNYARSKFNTESGGVKTTTTTRTNQFDISLGIQYYFGGIKPVEKPTNFNY